MESDAHLSPATPVDPPEGYPEDMAHAVELNDGTTIHVRPIVPADIERLRHAFEVGDSDSIRRRFLTGAPPSDESRLVYLTEIDYIRRLALLALDDEGNSIGIARYEASADLSTAEVAIVIEPDWRHRGIGGLLLGLLEGPAQEAGVTRLVAVFQPDNRAIDGLLCQLGYEERWFEDGLTWLAKPL